MPAAADSLLRPTSKEAFDAVKQLLMSDDAKRMLGVIRQAKPAS